MARGKKTPHTILKGVRGNGVLLEEMRAQNRATIEAVEASRVALEDKIDTVARETGGRLTVLETAVRQNSKDIRRNSKDIRKNSEDILKNSEDIRKNSEDIRKNSEDIRKNSDDIRKNSDDIRVLAERVEALGPLDQRVSTLERRVFGEP
jgi:methyl-accepting chemotaxis protein